MLQLTEDDIARARDLRRALHRAPELSGAETATAACIATYRSAQLFKSPKFNSVAKER